ncbi:MAG: class I SAM-dependent methyltransferase, partial [Bdellovibrionota bacterium]
MARTSSDAQDSYISNLLKDFDFPAAQAARAESDTLQKTMISLSVPEAQILSVILFNRGIKKAVEIGTLTGHSGLFILKSLAPGGTLWTFEKDPLHAQKAEKILKDSALSLNKTVHVMLGDAEEKLPTISDKGPFDAIFIDGNKGA